MKLFRYPPRALYGDYLRSAAGLFVGFGVLLAVPPSPAVLAIFGSIAALFAVFGLRTALRHKLRVAVTGDEIACRGVTTKVMPWSRIEAMKLRYFGARRSKWRPSGSGFMQLTLKGGGIAMTFESSIDGFDWLAGQAAMAMRSRGLALDPATSSNLIELGIDPAGGEGDGAAGGRGDGTGGSPDGCDSPPNVL
ncbi:hypothetical protein [Pelagibius marinus]|uniref:hypothetical protein n=1 Tax=Pelagibius marinus TaxID=2762760 RepID=UPI0018722867|nr:hypothetical protein [Pelagibius marinus]